MLHGDDGREPSGAGDVLRCIGMESDRPILITGGAGFIGSHTARLLTGAGRQVVIVDSLEKGHRSAISNIRLEAGRLQDEAWLTGVIREVKPSAVIHFAASIEAGESVGDPGRYFWNNSFGSLCLLRAMAAAGVGRLVFSSTAAVYGEPRRIPIPEEDAGEPTNPYGVSKWLVEQMLPPFRQAHGIRSIVLRYFNAAGSDPEGRLGEDHRPETHLIPLTLQVALGRRRELAIFGVDYPTPDGTAIRDYIHVSDLARAHLLAIEALENDHPGGVYNVGTGAGFSVREVIETASRVTGHTIPAREQDRRPGDPACLVAGSSRLKSELGWSPEYPDLETMIRHAWEWRSRNPDGYPD